jgi:hypothetical protein
VTTVRTLYFINKHTGDKYKQEYEIPWSDQREGEEFADVRMAVNQEVECERRQIISDANEAGYELVTMTEYYRFKK